MSVESLNGGGEGPQYPRLVSGADVVLRHSVGIYPAGTRVTVVGVVRRLGWAEVCAEDLHDEDPLGLLPVTPEDVRPWSFELQVAKLLRTQFGWAGEHLADLAISDNAVAAVCELSRGSIGAAIRQRILSRGKGGLASDSIANYLRLKGCSEREVASLVAQMIRYDEGRRADASASVQEHIRRRVDQYQRIVDLWHDGYPLEEIAYAVGAVTERAIEAALAQLRSRGLQIASRRKDDCLAWLTLPPRDGPTVRPEHVVGPGSSSDGEPSTLNEGKQQ